MKGYKNTTKTVYETESSANFAKGGKAMAKVGKVMGEFKRGTLHSGSKKGPEVKSPKQAIAIALNEARGAGAKIPMRKAEGGAVMDPGGYRIGGGRGTHRYAKDGDGWRMDASEFKVLKDITARDLADIEKGKRPGASKLDKMAAAEAERRQNRQGYASEGYDEDTGIGLMRKSRISDPAKRAASDAVRPKVYKAEGGKVKAPPPKAKPYDPVKDEPTSRPLTADQVRNLRNQMKANPPKKPAKRPYDPVLDEPTSRPFKTGGYVKKQAGGLMAERELGAREMVGKRYGGKVLRKAEGGPVASPPPLPGKGSAAWAEANGLPPPPPTATPPRGPDMGKGDFYQEYMDARAAAAKSRIDARDAARAAAVNRGMGLTMLKAKGGAVKGSAAKAVHKHERNMHPGKPLTKMRNGGKVGC